MGNAELMRVLHDQHAAPLSRYVNRLTGGDHGRSDDIVQETLLRAWRDRTVLDQGAGSARRWLFTVAKRIVIDEWRARNRRKEVLMDTLPEHGLSDVTEGVAENLTNRAAVLRALTRLSPDHRHVIVECYIRGVTTKELATALSIPHGTVKSRTYYALRAFREALDLSTPHAS